MMYRYQRFRWVFVLLLAAGALTSGCRHHARMTGRKLRHPEIKTVSPYELTLGPDASSQLVAFVLLRALSEDVHAANEEARERALDVQFDLCAVEHIGRMNVFKSDPDEHLNLWVRRWAPAVSRYVDAFETDWEQASKQLVLRGPTIGPEGEANLCEVLREVEDPAGTSTSRVVLAVRLAREQGYWRVLSVGYDSPRRSLARHSRGVTVMPRAPAPVNGPPPAPPAEPVSDD